MTCDTPQDHLLPHEGRPPPLLEWVRDSWSHFWDTGSWISPQCWTEDYLQITPPETKQVNPKIPCRPGWGLSLTVHSGGVSSGPLSGCISYSSKPSCRFWCFLSCFGSWIKGKHCLMLALNLESADNFPIKVSIPGVFCMQLCAIGLKKWGWVEEDPEHRWDELRASCLSRAPSMRPSQRTEVCRKGP